MSNRPILLTAVLALISVSGCTHQMLEKLPIVQAVEPVAVVVKQPLQIATWSPTKYNGRFTAMGFGYLTVVNNCLAMARDSKEVTTKDNTYLLVLADTSFSWNADKEILTFEGKPYKVGDELYLGGTVFTYPNANITDQIKVNWIECGLDKGWLGG
ncbi:hypothetical protein ES754_00845 [Psychrobacter frigidicola]|uniref:Uncharacterized protein n=1 Tax=Psychrobacter frigidicola TaxID=45611 RepID=A0A5C7A202_9GAMM|nr:hypothetical protein [Psychrobacter frigidicola]TXD97567.1 hypothetical protein ES754_00845 [Psychrobacter frigidicola]